MESEYYQMSDEQIRQTKSSLQERLIPEEKKKKEEFSQDSLIKLIQEYDEQKYRLHVSVQMCFLDNLQLSRTHYFTEGPSWELAGTKMANPKISVDINPNVEPVQVPQQPRLKLRRTLRGKISKWLKPKLDLKSQTLIMETNKEPEDFANKPCQYGIGSVYTWYNLTFPTNTISFQQALDVTSLTLNLSFAFVHKGKCMVGAKANVDLTQDLRDWIQQDKEEQINQLKVHARQGKEDIQLLKVHQTKEFSVPLEMDYVGLKFPEMDDRKYEFLNPGINEYKIIGHVIFRVELLNYPYTHHPNRPIIHQDLSSLLSNHEYAKESALHLFKNYKYPTSDRNLDLTLIKDYFNKVEEPGVFEIISELSTRLSKNPLKKALNNLKVARKKEKSAKKKNEYTKAGDWAAEKEKCEDCIVRYLDLFTVLQGQKAKGETVKASLLLDSLFKASLKFRASRVLSHPVIQKVLYDKWGKKVHLEEDRCNDCPSLGMFFTPKGSFFLNLLSYVIFLVILTLPFATINDKSYWFYNYVDQTLLEPPNANTPGYRTMLQYSDFWNWLIGQFGPGLFQNPNREGYLMLVGTPLIRQFRTKYIPCDYPSARTPLECAPPLQLSRNDWEQGGTFLNITPWTTNYGNSYTGFMVYTSVPSGGYTQILSLNQTELISQLQTLQNATWIDTATRVIMIEVLVYSANSNRLSFLELHVDFTSVGALVPSVFYYTISEEDMIFSRYIWLRVLEITYLFGLLGVKIRDYVTAPTKSYFADTWNRFDIPWIIAMLVVILMSFQKYVLPPSTVTNSEFYNAWQYYFWREFIEGCLVSFAYFRLGYFTRMFKTTGILLSILKVIAIDILLYLCLEVALMMGFAFMFYSLYGNTDFQNYRTYGTVAMTLTFGVFGNFPFQSAYYQTGANSLYILVGLILACFFLILGFIIVTNILVAMMSNSYDSIRQEALQRWSFDFSHLITKFQGTTWPPPFNILGYIYHYFRVQYIKAHPVDLDDEKPESTARNKYPQQSKLVKKLISMYDESIKRERQSGNSTVQSWRDDLNLETEVQ